MLNKEQQEVLLEAIKALMRIALQKFELPGHLDINWIDENPGIVGRRGSVIGFRATTLTIEDFRNNKKDLENVLAPLKSFGFSYTIEDSSPLAVVLILPKSIKRKAYVEPTL